ncbi:MAG: hypothetical protein ACRDGJ_09175 [Candidatus Limnocylindria bacterium]
MTGNGAPSGQHYTLNIIGVDKGKTAPLTGSDRHAIFVWLNGTSKILLQEDTTEPYDFQVLDGNATDGSAAFMLPDPGLAFDGGTLELTDSVTWYSAYIRPLGTPGGSAVLSTCAEIVDTLDLRGNDSHFSATAECTLVPVGADILTRSAGKSTFENMTRELLTLTLDLYVDGVFVQQVVVPIFDDAFESVWWEYDNNGLRLAQIRIYPCATDVLAPDATEDQYCG